MDVSIVPILDDNYAYVIQSGGLVGVIDPGEAKPIIDYLNDRDLTLDWVINTHKHGDHIDGNAQLIEKYNAKLAAPAECGDADITLQDGVPFKFGDTSFDITLTVGHTSGHIILFDPMYRVLFSGDTLFSMGCGRLFEGSANDMFPAMQYIKSLPPETAIYCGHEYTASNAKFACSVMPNDKDVQARAVEIMGQQCTMPALLATELKTNPFLMAGNVDEFAQYRTAKDNF